MPLVVQSQNGTPVTLPLGQVADVNESFGPAQIDHLDRSRVITLEANTDGRPLSEVTEAMKAKIAGITFPPGYQVTEGGSFIAFTYLAPILQRLAGFGESAVGAVMLVYGISVAIGNIWGGKLADRARHLFLPVIALGVGSAAGVARYMRGAMLEVVHQDFIRTARAKGLSERTVIFKHALRNALIPIITLLGLYLPFLLSGAVLVETIFAWPGMGRTIVEAILARDYPLVMATSFVIAAIVVLGNLLSDVLYAVVDPRIRNE